MSAVKLLVKEARFTFSILPFYTPSPSLSRSLSPLSPALSPSLSHRGSMGVNEESSFFVWNQYTQSPLRFWFHSFILTTL